MMYRIACDHRDGVPGRYPDVDALVNTVNTVGVMGKGIALQFKRAFPDNFRAYRAACERGDVRVGEMFVVDRGSPGSRRYIINFPTKRHWRGRSRLDDIRAGLDALVETVGQRGIGSIAVPALGCGNGGLEWRAVRPLIEQAAQRIPDVRVVVFPPEGAPPPEFMPDATAPPSLTRLRALLIVAIGRYLERARLQEVRGGISELEVQKLAYFLQVFGTPLRLTFTRGHYGPYAQSLGPVLELLEGHHLTGLGVRSARVTDFAPINPRPTSLQAAEDVVAGHTEDLARLDALLELVDGFETPYSLELLATVHFAAQQPPASGEVDRLIQRVREWSLRKARLFTDAHIRLAAARLNQHGLLPAT